MEKNRVLSVDRPVKRPGNHFLCRKAEAGTTGFDGRTIPGTRTSKSNPTAKWINGSQPSPDQAFFVCGMTKSYGFARGQ